jgi:hypothetical protein
MGYFFNKKPQVRKPSIISVNNTDNGEKELNNNKNSDMVENIDKVSTLEDIVLDEKPVKRVKKDKGLIERTESSKVILTEDNKQLLMD